MQFQINDTFSAEPHTYGWELYQKMPLGAHCRNDQDGARLTVWPSLYEACRHLRDVLGDSEDARREVEAFRKAVKAQPVAHRRT